MQPVMGAVIGALTGSDDPNEVAVMAKQASEVEISDKSFLDNNHQQPHPIHPNPNPHPRTDETLIPSSSNDLFR